MTCTPAGTISGSAIAAGTISAPTVTVTPATAQVQYVADLGKLPTYTPGAHTAGSVGAGSGLFATEGLVGSVEAETLTLVPANTIAGLVQADVVLPTHTDGVFDPGALPVLGAAQTVVVGIDGAIASAPVFTGIETAISATFAGTEVTHEVVGGKVTAVKAANINAGAVDVVKECKSIAETKTITVQ